MDPTIIIHTIIIKDTNYKDTIIIKTLNKSTLLYITITRVLFFFLFITKRPQI